MKRFVSRLALAWLCLLSLPCGAGVIISEFLPENDGGLRDADGDSPDWIELQNNSATPVNLAGWHLTDSVTNLAKWTFPATNLVAGGYLIVFASGNDRAVAGAELHTSFQLDSGGEFLALIAPDGVTVVSAFTNYPALRRNVSFGVGNSNAPPTTLLAAGSAFRWLLPTNGALGTSWTLPGFDASSWSNATMPARYDFVAGGSGGTPVLSVDFNDRDNNTAANTQPGFSNFVIGAAGGTALMQTGAVTRTFGSLSVTLSNSAPTAGYDDRFRTTPVNAGTFTLEDIFQGVIFSNDRSSTNGLDIFVSGLAPSQPYQFSIWSYDALSGGNRVSDWSVNGTVFTNNYTFDGALLPANDLAYRFGTTANASASGGLLISGRRDTTTSANNPGVFLNALQIAPFSAVSTTNGNLAGMAGRNASVYLRQSFTVANPAMFNEVKLRVRYDDGFVAYLNGVEVARRNSPATPAWDSAATAEHSAAMSEEILLPGAVALLIPGTNVLAIQGMNIAAADTDFLIEPELVATLSGVFAGRYFSPPTPGVANAYGYDGIVADTRFSADRGFYDAPFTVAITSATATASIYWTTNGSAPSPSNGALYTAPLLITNTSFVRAAAFVPGLIPSDVDTHTYIFLNQVLRQSAVQPGYPTNWQASYPADYGMDSNIVNSPVYGPTISNDLRAIPTLSIVADHLSLWSSSTGIYVQSTSSGLAWERPASAELIDGSGKSEFALGCRIQMHGNASRDNVRTPKHAMGLTFSSDYGPTKLRHDWFGGGVDEFDKIILRGCGFVDGWAGRYADNTLHTSAETGETFRGLRYRPENTCYLRDAWVKDSFRAMGWDASRSAYVHLYLNGLYWGLYEPSERIDSSYFSSLRGGQEGAWDVVVGEDNNGPPVLVDGSLTDWQSVLNLVNAGITNEVSYQAVAALVDLDNLIDYMLLHIFVESEDWPRHNWYAAHRRATNGVPGTKFVFTVWDQELTLDRLVRDSTRNRINVGTTGGEVYSPARVYAQLRAWPEFRVRFGDRVHKHLFNSGALTPSNGVSRLLSSAATIRDALTGESARWGDARKTGVPAGQIGTGVTFTRDEWWQPEIDKMATNFLPRLTADNVARFRSGSLYPLLGAPGFSQFGGAVSAGFTLGMTHTNSTGVIYFTLDGTDPRAYGTGLVAPAAQAYDAPVLLNSSTLVRARVLSGGQWSALVEAPFYPPQDLSKLALAEIMYHPPDVGPTNSDEFEFIELKNAGTNTLNLSGLTFTAGINFAFTNGTLLAPGEFFVLVRNPAGFAAKYPGVSWQDIYSGRLVNSGETITLSLPTGGTVFSVAYNDLAPWPVAADGYGFSLVPREPGITQAADDGAKWRASTLVGGSPGADDPAPNLPMVVINEVLSASVLPERDRIELRNLSATSADISGWFLSDDAATPQKFRIPNGTVIAVGGFVTFDETQFNPTPGTNGSFALGAQGDEVYHFSADAAGHLTGWSHGFNFGPAAAGVTFGRHLNSVGEEQLPAQLSPTFDAPNSGPRVGPVVLNEIHYHPVTNGDEFVELKNITGAAVSLFDPLFPTNTWRLSGADFVFPTNVTLPAGGLLLLVATNPVDFRARYSVSPAVPVFGPYAGALQDSGERLQIERPEMFGTNGRAFITVDEVRYNDRAPWPPAADGSGPSLQRINASAYGDDPINWLAAVSTPGVENSPTDSDGDGLPDDWETANGTQVGVADAGEDPDGDGMTNWQELQAGTHPRVAESSLKLEALASDGAQAWFRFTAISNRTYSVLTSPQPQGGAWTKFLDVSAAPTNREIIVTDALTNASRFFRLVTPAQ